MKDWRHIALCGLQEAVSHVHRAERTRNAAIERKRQAEEREDREAAEKMASLFACIGEPLISKLIELEMSIV
jgi:hypothetical protein